MVFHWSLSDSKSQVSRTLLSILAVLNNAVVWMVSTHPSTSKSVSPFSNPLVTVPNAPITIGIIVSCMFHSFFNSLARSRYLSFFSHSFSFILWSAGTAKSTILKVLFFLLIIVKSGLLVGIRWSVCMLRSHRSLCVAFSRTCAGLCICHLLVWSNLLLLFVCYVSLDIFTFSLSSSINLMKETLYRHDQLVNTAPHVTLTGWLLTGRSNVNKKNNPFMAVYEINLKRE